MPRHAHRIAPRNAGQAPRRGHIDRQHQHDVRAPFRTRRRIARPEERQRLTVDGTQTGKENDTSTSIIERVFRYINSFLSLFLALSDVAHGCGTLRRCHPACAPSAGAGNAPSQWVIWCGSALLQVMRNITRQ